MSGPTLITSAELGALPGYYRFWTIVDGPIVNTIQRERGMSGSTALRAANAYSVARTFGGSDHKRWDWIAERIKALSKGWTSEFRFNSALCAEAAKDISRQLGGKIPYSGVSKLVWFFQPDGWTIYDSLAAKALIGNVVKHRFFRFYEALDGEFQDVSASISSFAEKVEPRLRAERVIDQLLVLRGMTPQQRHDRLQEIEDWLLCLPAAVRSRILAVNEAVAPRIAGALQKSNAQVQPNKVAS